MYPSNGDIDECASALATRLSAMLRLDDVAVVAAAAEPDGAAQVALVTLRVGKGPAARYCAGAGAGDSLAASLWAAMGDAIGGRTGVLHTLAQQWANVPGLARAVVVSPHDQRLPPNPEAAADDELAVAALAASGGSGVVTGRSDGLEVRVLALGGGEALLLESQEATTVASMDAWLAQWVGDG